MNKKILVISYTALMASSPNGRTMQSLLQGFSSSDLALFCCYGLPDRDSCASCYKVSNKDVVKAIYKPKCAGRIVDMDSLGDATTEIQNDQRKGGKIAWKYLVKELIWSIGAWNNKKLKNWLEEQKPECVVYMYGNNAGLQNLAVYVAKKFNIPLIVYTCEDYCLKDYNYIDRKKGSLWFWLFHKLTGNATKRLFKHTDSLIANSDRLGLEYQKKYNIKNVTTVMMASQMEFIRNSKVQDIENIEVCYLGALGHYRIKALTEIGDALQRIDARLKLHVYGRITDELKEKLISCQGVEYHGFVSYEEVQRVMRTSTLLIETITDDPYINKNKKYGFSTKYADCFACGTPLLVYAPEEIIETEFALEHNCAFVATKNEDLESVLRIALFDEDARNKQLDNAKRITDIYFNNEKNCQTVADLLGIKS